MLDLGVRSYGAHFHYQLDSQLTWLNLKPKSKLGRAMNVNDSIGSAETNTIVRLFFTLMSYVLILWIGWLLLTISCNLYTCIAILYFLCQLCTK